MRRRAVPATLVLVTAVLAAAALAGCGSSRTAGAGDLTATTDTPTPVASLASRVGDTLVRFARTPLRGTAHELVLPRGWRAERYATVGGARFEAWSPQGTLLVSSPASGTVTELTPIPGRPGASPRARTIVSGLTNPQGLAFDEIGGHEYLYVAASDALYCYRFTAAGDAIDRTTTVAGLPDTKPAGDDVHRLKDVVVAPDHDLFVNIGSSSNATIPTPPPSGTLPRASVVEFSPTGRLLRVWATGVRNAEGLALAPDGSLWAAVNERDQIPYPFHRAYDGHADAYGRVIPAYVDDHPPDEVAKLSPGRNLGWPYCDPDPDTDPGASDTTYDYAKMPFTDDEATNPGGRRLDCAGLAPIDRGLPAHSAPLGLTFLQDSRLPARWRNGALVAGHGSWDRQPPRPPVIYWMAWNRLTHTLGRAITLVSGLQEPDGRRWGRLADAVPGPDGSLYLTDDQSGAVYRVTP